MQRGWIGKAIGIFGVGRRLSPTAGAFATGLPCLLPATATVVSVRRRPNREKGECPPAQVDIARAESRSNRVADRAPVFSAVRDRRWFRYRKMDIGAATDATESMLPRVGLVFCLRQCDKKNQGWREGPPLTVPCQSFDLLAGLHPPTKIRFERNKNTAFNCFLSSTANTPFSFGRLIAVSR